MHTFDSSYLIPVLLALVSVFLLRQYDRRSRNPLPPGPRSVPLIGNLFDMPPEKEWEAFSRWGKIYGGYLKTSSKLKGLCLWCTGDICSITVLGRVIVVINSPDIAFELLDKRSSIYSDRPHFQMAGELAGFKNLLALLQYGERLRRYRRILYGWVGSPKAVVSHHVTQETESKRLLRRIYENSDDSQSHVRE
jgi:hypothetical protein